MHVDEEAKVEKYGFDPREFVTEPVVADTAWAAEQIVAGKVGRLETVGQLQAAIDASGFALVVRHAPSGCCALLLDAVLAYEHRRAFYQARRAGLSQTSSPPAPPPSAPPPSPPLSLSFLALFL